MWPPALQVSTHTVSKCVSHVLCSVPFDEDDKDVSVWFLDHNYLENMAAMYKKVNGQWRTSTVNTLYIIF